MPPVFTWPEILAGRFKAFSAPCADAYFVGDFTKEHFLGRDQQNFWQFNLEGHLHTGIKNRDRRLVMHNDVAAFNIAHVFYVKEESLATPCIHPRIARF